MASNQLPNNHKVDELDDDDSVSVYDSGAEEFEGRGYNEYSDSDTEDSTNDGSSEEFEDQGSSDDEDFIIEKQIKDAKAEDDDSSSGDSLEVIEDLESSPRQWKLPRKVSKRDKTGKLITTGKDSVDKSYNAVNAESLHADDFSSDDEDRDGTSNRIGRVPLHWYDEYDHIGYNVHGSKVAKQSASGKDKGEDLLDQALRNQDKIEGKKYIIHDALNDTEVKLTQRQLELIRRVQAGAFAHPEHDANPDYIPYYSGVDQQISGINSDRQEPKARFQPSKYEKMQVRRLLHKLKTGDITMEYLTGEVRDMNDIKRKSKKDGNDGKPYQLWKGGEEDELNNHKGPQNIAAPKVPPPTHAASYNPPDEYLPTEDELKQWEEMDTKDRPHGLLIPQKFPNLRSVGAYEHAVREHFERCLDLYLCPRAMKRRLNIDPESLIPSLPKASDLRPFPTSKCIQYDIPISDGQDPPMVRCLGVSPDGQFLASGATDGYVRLWEVQTGRLMRQWNISKIAEEKGTLKKKGGESESSLEQNNSKPVVALEWNPNRNHHCLLAAVGKTAFIIATGTGGPDDAELTDTLLSAAIACNVGRNNVQNVKAAKAVKWKSVTVETFEKENLSTIPVSVFGGRCGSIAVLQFTNELSCVKWHKKGDYFVTVTPKAGAASVLIHQLSKANSQQPFSKSKGGEAQSACFHPSKPFLFVCTRQQIRIYHLVKQAMVKRLLSGCKWISSMDVHVSGDHVIAGSLDRRMVWFDLDLSSTPYKTLKYHTKALRHVGFHPRYPLMASASDDGSVHVFHSMVYSDLMRNPMIVPVKILREHDAVKKLGVLSFAFHPTQPWLFSAGADGKVQLYQDI